MRCQVLRVFVMCVCYHNRRCTDKMIKMMHKAITLTRTLVETKKTQREMKAIFFYMSTQYLKITFFPTRSAFPSLHTPTLFLFYRPHPSCYLFFCSCDEMNETRYRYIANQKKSTFFFKKLTKKIRKHDFLSNFCFIASKIKKEET